MENNLPSVQEINSLEMIAKTAAKTTFFGKNSPEEILMILLVARDLNIPRSVVLARGLNIINGSVEISARVMNMLIRRNGHQLKQIVCTDNGCHLWGKRKDTGEEMEVFYTLEDAKKANLIRPGGGWTKNPSDMCFARAISRLARRLFPDCIGNCYVEGEIEERTAKASIASSSNSPELPTPEEMEGDFSPPLSTKEVIKNLPLPTELNEEHVCDFVEQTALSHRTQVKRVIANAQQNLEGFIEVFKKWEAKNFPPLLEEPVGSALS